MSEASDDATRRSYDTVAETYAEHLRHELDGKPLDRALLAMLIEEVAGEPASVFAEMHRVVRPGGPVMVAFHCGTEVRHVTDWWGHEVDVDFRFYEPDAVVAAMEEAGLSVEARLERSNYRSEVATERAYLIARRPA